MFSVSQGDADKERDTQPDSGANVEPGTVLTPDQRTDITANRERTRRKRLSRKSAASMTILKTPVQQKGLTSTLSPGDVADDVADESGNHGVVPSPEMSQALATATAEASLLYFRKK